MSQRTERLLEEYLALARDFRHTWAHREGDEADFKLRHWERKIEEINAELASVRTQRKAAP